MSNRYVYTPVMIKKAVALARELGSAAMNAGHASHIGSGTGLADTTVNTVAGLDAAREIGHGAQHAIKHVTAGASHTPKWPISPVTPTAQPVSALGKGMNFAGKALSKAGPAAWGTGMGMQARDVYNDPSSAQQYGEDTANKGIVGRAFRGLSNAPATLAYTGNTVNNTMQATRELPAQQEQQDAMQRQLISQQNSKVAPVQGPAAPIKPMSPAQEFPKPQYPRSTGL